jgi:predicted nucleic acid-binding protein
MKFLPETQVQSAVLDTNVVLDWMLFKDVRCSGLVRAIENGKLRWLTTCAMREEFTHVLSRKALQAWAPDSAQIWQAWQQFSCQVRTQAFFPPPSLRCTDIDDQIFIDTALQHAQWLFTRDREVLKLARYALPLGLRIRSPEPAALQFI